MKTKRVLALLLAVCLIAIMSACGGTSSSAAAPASTAPTESTAAPADGTAEPAAGGDTKDLRLASHNAVIEGNSYRVRYEQDIKDAAAAAADHGLNVSYSSFVSNWDPSTESQQLENSINEGYDIILVNPVAATGLDPIIEKALDAGITYINCDCEYTTPMAKEILNICTDQYYLGYKTATYIGDVLGEGAKVVWISAIDGNAANDQRDAGFQAGIDEKGLEVVQRANHDWDGVLAQQVMTEILNSGVEFDGILVSQMAENVITAYETVYGADVANHWPQAVGFGDTGLFMQQMQEINAEEEVLPYIVVSNPPGVGATALNFGLNMILGNELRDDIEYGNPEYNSIYLESKVWYTYEHQDEYKELAESTQPGDAISYWLTMDEVKDEYFK